MADGRASVTLPVARLTTDSTASIRSTFLVINIQARGTAVRFVICCNSFITGFARRYGGRHIKDLFICYLYLRLPILGCSFECTFENIIIKPDWGF